jgi:uncharacterized protein
MILRQLFDTISQALVESGNAMALRRGILLMALCATLSVGCRRSEEVGPGGKALSPLLAAAKRGDASTIEKLLSSGAAPNDSDAEGVTALIYAVSSGKIGAVRALLAGGANVRLADRNGYTVLHAVAVDREHAIAELLLSAGADVNARTKDNITPLMASVCSPYSDATMSLTLIRAGADVNIVDSDGETALSCATSRTLEVIEELLKRGANPNIQSKRFSGETPLHLAAMNGSTQTVELLLRYGANPAIRNNEGQTPLDITNVKFDEVRKLLSSHSTDGH